MRQKRCFFAKNNAKKVRKTALFEGFWRKKRCFLPVFGVKNGHFLADLGLKTLFFGVF
jgi:hypothetical protein